MIIPSVLVSLDSHFSKVWTKTLKKFASPRLPAKQNPKSEYRNPKQI